MLEVVGGGALNPGGEADSYLNYVRYNVGQIVNGLK